MTKYQLATIAIGLLSIFSLNAQNTYSPFSSVGLGEIASDYGRTTGMGNVGIGIQNRTSLSTANPASIAAIDSLTGIFEVGVSGKFSNYTSSTYNDNAFVGSCNKIALGFRCNKLWSLSAGIKPYSNVGYHITDQVSIEGTNNVSETVFFEGDGGLYNLYVVNAFSLLKNRLSVGVITSMIAGSFSTTEDHATYSGKTTSRATQFYNKFGAQYHFYNKLGHWVVGGTYGYKQKLTVKNRFEILEGATTTDSEKKRNTQQFIPETYGIGASLTKDKFVFAADGEWERWSGLESGIANVRVVDALKFKVGIGYTPYKDLYTASITKQYQVGLQVNKSYLQINDGDVWNCALTGGVTFPLRTGISQKGMLNLGLEIGRNFIAPQHFAKENYVLLNVNFSFIEAMFMRRKIK